MNYRYSISGAWGADRMSKLDLRDRVVGLVEQLTTLSGVQDSWAFLDNGPPLRECSLSEFESDLENFLSRNLYDPDYGAARGYSVVVHGRLIGEKLSLIGDIELSLSLGSGYDNRSYFNISQNQRDPNKQLISYQLYHGVLAALVQWLQCPWLVAKLTTPPPPVVRFDPSKPIPVRPPTLAFENAWIGYLSAPLAKGLTPSRELVVEDTPGGGLIMSAAVERLDLDIPDHVRRSKQLQWIMGLMLPTPTTPLFRWEAPARVGPY
jgi:hypothetical protein